MTSIPALRRTRPLAAAAAVTAVAALTLSGLVVAPASAADEPFLSSFEQGDPAPQISTPLENVDPVNMSGIVYANGSLLGSVTGVTATAENGPGEAALNLADGSASSKWLAFAPTASITYELSEPQTLRAYTLTSGNDAEQRDPLDWAIQASLDGETWVELDTQTGQDFVGRGTLNAYTLENETAYGFYRLDITRINSGNITQLADWDIQDGSDDAPLPGPMTTVVGAGPTSGYNLKTRAGFSGVSALRYGGAHLAEGAASATNVVYDELDTVIQEGDELSYKIMPVLDEALTYSATYTAVDLLLSDGTRLSEKGLVDQNGFGADAAEQGRDKGLYGNQWNSVKIDLSPLAGQSVEAVLVEYDNPDGNADVRFSGWIDDVRLDEALPIGGDELIDFVDTRRGTQSSASFSRGNNIPATAVPNGFNFFVPMTDADSQSWLYQWSQQNNAQNLPELEGIGISHEPSPWMGDRNQLAVMPSTSAVPDAGHDARALAFDRDDEQASPDLYQVEFTNGLTAAVTPTDHAGVYSFTFPDDTDTGSVLLDSVGGNGDARLTVDGATVSGWVEGGSGLSAGRSRMFVHAEFDRAPVDSGEAAGDRPDARYAGFDVSDDKTVEMRIATSFISLAQAEKNLDLEASDRPFDEIRAEARAEWQDRLDVIEVEGATPTQLTTLYSSLYRLNLYPNSQFENTGTADEPVFQYASPVAEPAGASTDTQTGAEIVDGKIYVNNGFWDTYRTVWPAYSLLYPDVAEELVDGFVQHYRDAGWIARWSSPGYADLMTGTSSDVAFAESYINGAISTETALDAYDAALKNASVLPTSSGVGRKGLDQSIFLGYTPEETHESVSWGLEGLINDYGIGRMAAMLADDPATPADRVEQLREEAEYFSVRATQYGNLFDESVDFFQARHADGSWYRSPEEFDPESWGDPYTETNGWNFAFHAPYDVDGLAALYGGTDGLIQKLDEFFATPETATKTGSYGGVIHEMVEARDVRMGQLGMSNQVSHHIPYMYAAAGEPSKTQAAVREILQRLFVGSDIGQGYAGDEDNGETSAWFVLSSLGLYPLALGSGEYTIGSPLFEKATLDLGEGKTLVVEAPQNSDENIYVQSVSFDGEPVEQASIDSRMLTEGGTLSFEMGAEASDWGTRTSDVEKREPLVDATDPQLGVTTIDDGTVAAGLVDDSSRSSVGTESATPTISYRSSSGPVSVASYTLTNGPEGDAPSAWRLEASSDGTSWVTLDEREGEEFRWGTQTRPFELADAPMPYENYRIVITATAGGAAPRLAEVELLADPSVEASDFALTPATEVSGRVGVEVDAPLATLAGGESDDAADYEATVDFLDGEGPQPATLTTNALGAWSVSAPHVFDRAGTYTAQVSVTEGLKQAGTETQITISRDDSLVGAFDSVCIGSVGAGGSCDVNGYTFLRDSLADQGFVQGETVALEGEALDGMSFDLPDVEPGQPDNLTSNGSTVAVDLGEGATRMSFVGTATQKNVELSDGLVTFTDGSTQPLTIGFGDWTGAAANPQFGNTVFAISEGRLSGDSTIAGGRPAIYVTAPIEIPAGKQVATVTMPEQTGSHQEEGRLHVFAVASDGERAPQEQLVATASEQQQRTVEETFTTELATIAGGTGDYTATVNWGDGTGLTEADVEGDTVSGEHTYAEPGDYTVSVTVDDGIRSAAATATLTVVDAPVYTPTLGVPSEEIVAGSDVAITGEGFAPGERVELELSTAPIVTVEATADDAGAITASMTVPADAPEGSYPLLAVGDTSRTPASAMLRVVEAEQPPVMLDPSVILSTDTARPGDAIGVEGTGFGGGEEVTVTFRSDPVLLGTFATNADGVFTAQVEIPADAEAGDHVVEVEGLGSGAVATAAIEIVVEAPGDGTDPGEPGTDPGAPGTDPGTDPGTPGTGPGTPGTDPGTPGTGPDGSDPDGAGPGGTGPAGSDPDEVGSDDERLGATGADTSQAALAIGIAVGLLVLGTIAVMAGVGIRRQRMRRG